MVCLDLFDDIVEAVDHVGLLDLGDPPQAFEDLLSTPTYAFIRTNVNAAIHHHFSTILPRTLLIYSLEGRL